MLERWRVVEDEREGIEECGDEARRGRGVGEGKDGNRGKMAGVVERTAVGSDEPERARGRRGHGGGHSGVHGAVMLAVAAAAGGELQLSAAGKQHRQGTHGEKRDDEDGEGTPHR